MSSFAFFTGSLPGLTTSTIGVLPTTMIGVMSASESNGIFL